MGKQTNKIEKRQRRLAYLKRKKQNTKAAAVKAADSKGAAIPAQPPV